MYHHTVGEWPIYDINGFTFSGFRELEKYGSGLSWAFDRIVETLDKTVRPKSEKHLH